MFRKHSAKDFQEHNLFKCALDMGNIFPEQKGTISIFEGCHFYK